MAVVERIEHYEERALEAAYEACPISGLDSTDMGRVAAILTVALRDRRRAAEVMFLSAWRGHVPDELTDEQIEWTISRIVALAEEMAV